MRLEEDMPQSFDLFFASSNSHKFSEAKIILENLGIKLGFFNCQLQEIQSNSLIAISEYKAKQAFQKCKKPVIVEDDGLFIDSLKGFPGPYSSYVFQTIGNKGILELVKRNRNCKFVSIISYCDKKNLESFESQLSGTLSKKVSGKGWGYDPIFIPSGFEKTFAQLKGKNKISHRFKSLEKLSNWYVDN